MTTLLGGVLAQAPSSQTQWMDPALPAACTVRLIAGPISRHPHQQAPRPPHANRRHHSSQIHPLKPPRCTDIHPRSSGGFVSSTACFAETLPRNPAPPARVEVKPRKERQCFVRISEDLDGRSRKRHRGRSQVALTGQPQHSVPAIFSPFAPPGHTLNGHSCYFQKPMPQWPALSPPAWRPSGNTKQWKQIGGEVFGPF